MDFSELGLSDKVLAAVTATGYTAPTPIQAQAIPHVLQKKDVLGLAQTGTGKTASFVLPMLSMLERGRARARMPRTLILEPTRELAAQVEESFVRYGVNHKLTVALLIGGVSFGEQDKRIDRGADVVIATPGRLLDHLERGKLLLQGVDIFVVDEADRMLDMGFIPDVERICKILPPRRQTLFFSATMPSEIQSLVERFLTDPVRVEASRPSSAAETVTQSMVASGESAAEKRAALRKQIDKAEGLKNAIIFCNRKRDVGVVHRSLERHKYPVGALHGDMDQRSRMNTLEAFKKGEITLLVASDVAARGLDIPDVSHVFNYDVPHNAEDYVHRIGRTGRAGREGTAIMLVTPADAKSLLAIEKMLGNKLVWQEGGEPGEIVEAKAEAQDGRKRRRSSGRGKPEARASDKSGATSGDQRAPKSGRAERTTGAEAPTSPAEPATAEPAAAAPAPARARKDEPGREGRRDDEAGRRRRKDGGRGRKDDAAPDTNVAFGDTPFVPAFLLRPVRLRPLREVEGEEDDMPSDEPTSGNGGDAALVA